VLFRSDSIDLDLEESIKEILLIWKSQDMDNQEVFKRFLISKGNNDKRIFAKALVAYRKARAGISVLYPKEKEIFMELIKRGIKLGIVTDSEEESAWIKLTELGLEDLFEFVVAFDHTGKKKPNPEPFNKALDILKVDSKEILFVGDNPDRDIVGSKNQDMISAFALYGYYCKHEHKPLPEFILEIKAKYNPDYILENFSDILTVLKN
jgi:HAD superfamily hydrolase (TIGR01549 family)